MHLRAPSVAPGVSAFLWCLVFALYVWLFALAVGVSEAVAGLLAALVGGGVFLLVRLYGEDRRAAGARVAPANDRRLTPAGGRAPDRGRESPRACGGRVHDAPARDPGAHSGSEAGAGHAECPSRGSSSSSSLP